MNGYVVPKETEEVWTKEGLRNRLLRFIAETDQVSD
jgi:hypothetical protein